MKYEKINHTLYIQQINAKHFTFPLDTKNLFNYNYFHSLPIPIYSFFRQKC